MDFGAMGAFSLGWVHMIRWVVPTMELVLLELNPIK